MTKIAQEQSVHDLLVERLVPLVTSIDADSVYPESFLRFLGAAGMFSQPGGSEQQIWKKTLNLIEETAVVCGSTAFSIWCHTTAMVYVRNGHSSFLKNEILPKMVRGEVLGATGLSNPMKFYAGMESLRLQAEPIANGYIVSGFLPFVSNLGTGNWFGVIAKVNADHRIMMFIPCAAEGLQINERTEFLGLNGSATYNCHFQHVFVPERWVLAEDADVFIKKIRPEFVLNQAGMGIGLARSVIHGIRRLQEKQGGANQYLIPQPAELEERLTELRERAYQFVQSDWSSPDDLREVIKVRLDSSYLALDAANAGMLHHGGAAYLKRSNSSRRLREAYFIALVTPAVKQLEKILKVGWSPELS